MNDTSPPVFPRPASEFHADRAGISLRDYFAGQALVALIPICADGFDEMTVDAADAYACADAMLKQRDQ